MKCPIYCFMKYFKVVMNLNKGCIEMAGRMVCICIEMHWWTLTRVVLKFQLRISCWALFARWTLTRVVLKYIFCLYINLNVFRWTLTRVVLKFVFCTASMSAISGWTLTRVVLKSLDIRFLVCPYPKMNLNKGCIEIQ